MKESRRKRLAISVMAVLLGLGLASIPVFGMPDAPSGDISVCQLGPPACDYQTIQAGIDAANAGDTVLVSSGIYSEQLTLESGVAIQSATGSDVVTVTASSSPIVFANGAVSTAMQGIIVVGQEAITPAIGLELVDSDLTLSDCAVRDIYGVDGSLEMKSREAIAIRSTRSVLTVTGSTIEGVGGGDNFCGESCGGDGDGGGAWGVWADGGRLVISETIIRDIFGGTAEQKSNVGGRAVGVRVQDVDLTIEYSQLTRVMGGQAWYGEAGAALGIQADGGRVVINETIIHKIWGGNGMYSIYAGGRAVGVQVQSVDLTIEHSELAGVVSGSIYIPGPCPSYGRIGTEVVVQIDGGTVVLRANHFLLSKRSGSDKPRYIIHTSHTDGTYIEGNIIALDGSYASHSSNTLSGAGQEASMAACPPLPGSILVGIASEGDDVLHVENNSITGLVSLNPGGKAVGIRARNVGQVVVLKNIIEDISGGCEADVSAVGVWIERAETARLDANVVSKVRGEKGWECEYGAEFFPSTDGGGAVGIKLIATMDAMVANNTVWSVTGGDGVDGYKDYFGTALGTDGGDATAFHVVDGLVGVWNNTLYQTTAGAAGDLGGEAGSTIGFGAMEGADALAVNNVIIGHDVGISSTTSPAPLLRYNDLWNNEMDYVGVLPGVGDLHVDPGFVEAEFGDFHLVSGSSLIDAGTNVGAPVEDFEGDLRPLDGDNDGLARADIGADEYWQVLMRSKAVQPSVVEAGDILTYRLTFSNPSSYDRPNVTLTDTVPDRTAYVSGTLQATAGSWRCLNDVITWTGSLDEGEAVALAFSVKVDSDLIEPCAIVNQAELDDHIGEIQIMRATALVNPLRRYFPLVETLGE